MALLDKSNMITGHIIPASDVYQIVNAFTFSGSYDLLISGSVSVGTGSIRSDAKFYILQNLRVDGGITGSVTGSFTGDGTNIINVQTASYAISSSKSVSSSFSVTAAYALNADNSGVSVARYDADSQSFNSQISNVYASESNYTLLTTFNSFSSSYHVVSGNIYTDINTLQSDVSTNTTNIATNTTTIANVYASESKYTLTSSFQSFSASIKSFTSSYYTDSASFDSRLDAIDPSKIISGSTTVTAYPNGRVIVSSGSNNQQVQFIVSGSGSFTGTVQAISYYQNSLKALKTDILPFSSSAVELIDQVNVVSYFFKNDQSRFKIGFIADDTHEYLSTKDHNVLDATNCIGLLLKAVQELHKQNQELRKMIDSRNAFN